MKKMILAIMFTCFIGVSCAVEIKTDFLYTLVLQVIAEWKISNEDLVKLLQTCEKNNKNLGKQCWEVVTKLTETGVVKVKKTEEEVRTEVKEEVKEEVRAEITEDMKNEIKEQVKAELKAEEEEKKRLEEEARLEEEKRKEEEFKEKCIQNWRMRNINWEVVCIQPIMWTIA